MTRTLRILERLIGFPTISRESNLALISYTQTLLSEAGVTAELVHSEDGSRANLYATIGPQDHPGVMLSGHTDVVPVEGQDWSSDPFALRRADGRLYGRGCADMKGFVACALNVALEAAKRPLQTPLHLALSYDEEIGCVGVQRLINMLSDAPTRPALCIVGEPTAMAVATGHKGKTALKAICRGREGHSALAPLALNAVHLACDMIGEIRGLQDYYAREGLQDGDYDVPYTTLHVGKISGGVALNIVPNHCEVDFEIRNLADDDPEVIIEELRMRAAKLSATAQEHVSEADIRIKTVSGYPGLLTPPAADVVSFVKSLTGANGTIKVAYGTEGGLFSERLAIPTVVCGPGSMAQGHKPDEYVTEDQLTQCDRMLARLLERLEQGI